MTDLYTGQSDENDPYFMGPQQTQRAAQPKTAAAQLEPDATQAAKQALAVITNPTKILTDALPTSPDEPSKIPWGLAVLGGCVIAVMWAASLEKKQ